MNAVAQLKAAGFSDAEVAEYKQLSDAGFSEKEIEDHYSKKKASAEPPGFFERNGVPRSIRRGVLMAKEGGLQGLTEVAGAPSDLVEFGMNQIGKHTGLFDPRQSSMGDWIGSRAFHDYFGKKGLDWIGDTAPENDVERYIKAGSKGVGGMVLPGAAFKAAGAGVNALQTAISGAGAGVGSQAGADLFPESDWAPLIGGLAGGYAGSRIGATPKPQPVPTNEGLLAQVEAGRMPPSAAPVKPKLMPETGLPPVVEAPYRPLGSPPPMAGDPPSLLRQLEEQGQGVLPLRQTYVPPKGEAIPGPARTPQGRFAPKVFINDRLDPKTMPTEQMSFLNEGMQLPAAKQRINPDGSMMERAAAPPPPQAPRIPTAAERAAGERAQGILSNLDKLKGLEDTAAETARWVGGTAKEHLGDAMSKSLNYRPSWIERGKNMVGMGDKASKQAISLYDAVNKLKAASGGNPAITGLKNALGSILEHAGISYGMPTGLHRSIRVGMRLKGLMGMLKNRGPAGSAYSRAFTELEDLIKLGEAKNTKGTTFKATAGRTGVLGALVGGQKEREKK